MRRLFSFRPSASAVSNALEVSGLSAVAAGAWLQFGVAVGLMVSGVAAVLYGVALDGDS
jgi:hypothetical protein